jgi:two-component system sensor histidine kinase FlrB
LSTAAHSRPGEALDLEGAVQALSSISATLTESYAALERRAARVERELERKVRELDAMSRHLEAILDALPTGVVVRDAEGRVTRANGAALAILGSSERELAGAREHPLLADGGAQAGSGWRQREVDAQGGARRVLFSRRCQVPQGGSVEILDERTALVELTERLHALDKLASLGHMAGGIAHELRNPMHAAKGFAELLAKRLPVGGKEHHWARRVIESVAGAEEVLASMLTLAHPEQPLRERIEPRALLEDAVRAALEARVSEGAPVPWTIELAATAPPFLGDRVKLRQALRNLIANALDVQPQGGRVRVEARAEQGELCLAVEDAGPGVPSALRSRVLDPFFTTRPEGCGLGLSLVGTIAGLHGGRVDVPARRSELGGAVFQITLPLCPPGAS